MSHARTRVAALAIVLAAVATADAQVWLVSGFNNTLYDYTQGSGDADNPRTIENIFGFITDIDFGPDGVLYGLSSFGGNSLYKINPKTGETSLIGLTGLPTILEGDIGFDPTTNRLYGLYYARPAQNEIFTINIDNGSANFIGRIAADDPSGMAFDNTGNLWVVDTRVNFGGPPVLLRVNKVTGEVISTRVMPPIFQQPLLGMDFNPMTNVLYIASSNGGFYSVNLATGGATLVDHHNVPDAAGLAFVVPEPASLCLLAVGAASLISAGRLRRVRPPTGLSR